MNPENILQYILVDNLINLYHQLKKAIFDFTEYEYVSVEWMWVKIEMVYGKESLHLYIVRKFQLTIRRSTVLSEIEQEGQSA